MLEYRISNHQVINNSLQVKNTLVHLKVDIASRFSRSFFGVNIQYRNKQGTKRRFTLGVIETVDDHSGDYLLAELRNLLGSFGIQDAQIYSVTLDNGTNLVKMVKLLREDKQFGEKPESDGEDDESDEDFELDEIEVEEITRMQELQRKMTEHLCDTFTEWCFNSKYHS